jgi:flavin-dependent dehydrogenase
VLVVGDAAGLTKPTTGGGIYYSLVSAELAASVAQRALEEREYSAEFLSQYQQAWKVQLGSELRWGRWFRRCVQCLPDTQIDEAFQLAALEPLDRLIRERATFNWHGEVIHSLARNRQVRSFLLQALLNRGFQLMRRGRETGARLSSHTLLEQRT